MISTLNSSRSRSRSTTLFAAVAIIYCCSISSLTTVDAFSTTSTGVGRFSTNAAMAIRQRKVGSAGGHGESSKTTTMSTTTMSKTTQLFARQSSSEITPGIGEEGCNLPSVSEVNTKDEQTQQLIVSAIFLTLFGGTYLFSSGLHQATTFLGDNFESQYQLFRNTWPLAFGLVYSLAGITHFALSEEYENIFPTKGAWGVWNIPGSKSFHVAWTGVAELAGGLGLLAGGISSIVSSSSSSLAPLTSAGLESDAAAGLFLLTLAITPANIFMYTHGAKLPMESEPLPVTFHGIRWIMQVVLLGFLYQIGEETFQVLSS